MIVGTAGHVDHGKTSLVRALTGVDTDRLAEEKARGISIELGFAYARLDDAAGPVAFVDVPGHRRFVQTMIAGAAGIDVGLLVVAADDGPMPQTREHLDILRWLGVPRLVVALTKIDLVDADRVDDVTLAVNEMLDATPYRGSTIVPLSIVDGSGIDTLKATLREARASSTPRDASTHEHRRFRLAIDRAFVLKGIGLVVTGTALSGRVAIDDELALLPRGLVARVRGIHAQNVAVQAAHAGQRVALNVVGRGVEKSSVQRGDWLVAPSIAITSDRIDVALDPIVHEASDDRVDFDGRWRVVRFHAGAMSRNARVALLGDASSRIAQVVFDEPAHVVAGDRFVLRDATASDGASGSVAGGVVLDVDVPTRGRRTDARLRFLETAARGDAAATLDAALATSPKGIDLARWNATHNSAFVAADLPDAQAVVAGNVVGNGDVTLFARAHWDAMLAQVVAVLAAEHARAPDAVGPGRDRLRRMAVPSLDGPTFGALLDALRSTGQVAQTGAWLHLPSHRVELSADDRRRFERARALLELAGEPNNPPRVRDLARALADDEAAMRATMIRLASIGEVYRVAHDHYFLPATVHVLARIAAELTAADGVARAAPFRDRIGVGRKVAIQILEFFDRVGYTRRIGDDHRVIQPDLFADRSP